MANNERASSEVQAKMLGLNGDTNHEHEYESVENTKRTHEARLSMDCVAAIVSTLAFLVSAAALCLTIVLVTKVDGRLKSEKVADVELAPEVCTPCINLVTNPYLLSTPDPLMDKLTKKMDNGVEKCCASTWQTLTSMLEMHMRNQTVIAPLSQEGACIKNHSFSPVTLNKRMLPPLRVDEGTDSTNNNKPHYLVQFDTTHDDLTEHVRGVTVLNDALIIDHSGFYHIYGSFQFVAKSSRPYKASHVETLHSYVHRISPNSPRDTGILLRTVHSVCPDCPNSRETGFTGGNFFLKAGDLIRVCISELDVVEFDKESTFIGLTMLGSSNP